MRGGGEGGGALVAAAEPLFSATTLRDFSNTFQSLIVLSVRSGTKRKGGQREVLEKVQFRFTRSRRESLRS